MGKKLAKKKTRREEKSTTQKGKLLEEIVAMFHEGKGAKVERNVRIPVGATHKKREIDVLLTSHIAGYPIQVPIECKNEAKPIGEPKLDAFIGKLNHLGLPPQHSVYVSANGYTSDAVERAKEARIRPLILTGLTKDGLASDVLTAIQHKICLLLEVLAFNIRNDLSPNQSTSFFDETGDFCGDIYDSGHWRKQAA